MKNYSAKKSIRIINSFYNNTHNHIYIGCFKNFDYYHLFKCKKCDHEIELFIIECIPEDFSEKFAKDRYTFEYRYGEFKIFYICYLGNRQIFNTSVNNEICKNMLTCDEMIIKNIIE